MVYKSQLTVEVIKSIKSKEKNSGWFKKFICRLIGHDFKFTPFPPISSKILWCAYCGKDFTEDVKKEMELIKKQYSEKIS